MDRLGKYVIRGVLGRGAMGTVYEGWDPDISRRVAIKTVRLPDAGDSEEREQIDRFKREAQSAGRLHHPNVVGVYDYAETPELAYIVMEYVDGRTLKSILDEGPPPADATGRIMDGLLSGLEYSHAQGVTHRDIKPANVIVTATGGVKIADFGIARIESSTMTQAGTIMGTPAYMSPEQFTGVGVDFRTDIYSAGVVLFQLLTGKRPFEGSMATIMQAVLNKVPPRPSDLSTAIPPALDAVVARAMARQPAARYADAGQFRRALDAALQAPPPPRAFDEDATVVATPRPAPARPSRLPIYGAIAAVMILAAGFAAWRLRPQSTPPIDRTQEAQGRQPPEQLPPDPPHVDPPRVEPPRADPPNVDPPRIDPPRIDPPRIDPPRVDPPASIPTPDALRKAVAATLRTAPCSFIVGDERSPGAPALRGVVGEGAPEAALHAALQSEAPAAAVDFLQVTTVEPLYCPLLDLLRPYAQPFPGTNRSSAVKLENARPILLEGDLLRPRMTTFDYPAFLQLDYFGRDGSLLHVHEATGSPYKPTSSTVFGEPRPPGFNGFDIRPPFGTELLIGITTSVALFQAARPDDDTAEAYLPALRAALEAAAARNAHVSVSVLVLHTAPRR